jgi:hypothetical protein
MARRIVRRSRGQRPLALASADAQARRAVAPYPERERMAAGMRPGSEVEEGMKVVARRTTGRGLVATAPLLRLAVDLRGDKPFLPRGVHRFRSFEESEEWTLRMLTRPSKPARRS